MSAAVITAVGIDVSKYKSTVAARRPGGEVALLPFDISHDKPVSRSCLRGCIVLVMKAARFELSWSIQGCIGDLWLWRCNMLDSSSV